MKNYIWTQYNAEGCVIEKSQLYAKNLHHAQHLTCVYFLKKGNWRIRGRTAILEINKREYLILKEGYF